MIHMSMKTKGQPSKVAKLEPLAQCFPASWQSLARCTTVATNTVRGSESRTHRQTKCPGNGANRCQGIDLIQAKPYKPAISIMCSPAVDLNRRFQSDLPQLPPRHGAGGVLRKESGSTVEVPANAENGILRGKSRSGPTFDCRRKR
jgi:hypothetical protein